MWKQKSQSVNPRKSYNYLERLREFTYELSEMGEATQEFVDFISSLHDRCQNIVDKEEKRIEEDNGVK